MANERALIVNADDLGLSPGVNRGIIRAREEGVVTSASLLVRWPAATEAAAYATVHPGFGVGLHFDLAEWAYVHGAWAPRYEVVAANDPRAVRDEAQRQVAEFHRLMGSQPAHIDSHQHVHRSEPTRSVLSELARELGVPLRGCDSNVRYVGSFYGQTGTGSPLPECISLEALLAILKSLPPGVTELGCHPGETSDLESTYKAERAMELEVLSSPYVRAAILAEGIQLRSFDDLPRGSPTTEGSA